MELAIAIAANIVIGAILLALFALGRAPDGVRLTGPAEALAVYRRQFPKATGSAVVASDGLAAFFPLAGGGKIGLLHRHGRRWNARELVPEDLRSVTADGDTITISLTDFGWPHSHIRIADAEVRREWVSRLQELTPHA
jgi:hypothetical protein